MYAVFGFVIFYILTSKILNFFRKTIFEKIQDEIKTKLDKDEKIIYTGLYYHFGINLISFLCGLAGSCIFQQNIPSMKHDGYVMLLLMLGLSCIFITSQFKHTIFLTNKSVFFTYGYKPEIENIALKDIKSSKGDDTKLFGIICSDLKIIQNDDKQKIITHLTNLKLIGNEIMTIINIHVK